MQKQKRIQNFKNKKKTMIRAKKKAIKFTKRNFSKFEHVKRNIEIKRVKKNVLNKIIRICEKRNKNEERCEKKRREETTITSQFTKSIITRSNANVSKFMILFNNIEFNQSNDNNLHNSDDDFNVLKQNNENAKND